VTRSQLLVLRYLVEHGSSTMQDLAAGVGVTAPTMTGTVKVLLRKGLVVRRHGDDDWRTVLVEATEAGVLAQDQARDARVRVLARAISELTPEQRALLTLSVGSLNVLAQRLSAS
jgi:DNA-binding MarR family transcriptional regulator